LNFEFLCLIDEEALISATAAAALTTDLRVKWTASPSCFSLDSKSLLGSIAKGSYSVVLSSSLLSFYFELLLSLKSNV